ncbi:hypothetical protein BgiBS90_037303, partial [Biomphalaria glabrata]
MLSIDYQSTTSLEDKSQSCKQTGQLQICLAYSCTTYQQMFDGLSGSSLNTMKMATLILTSKHSVANNYEDGYTGISYQQCTPMIHKSSLPSHSAKQCVHLSCIGSDPLYCHESGYVRPRRS